MKLIVPNLLILCFLLFSYVPVYSNEPVISNFINLDSPEIHETKIQFSKRLDLEYFSGKMIYGRREKKKAIVLLLYSENEGTLYAVYNYYPMKRGDEKRRGLHFTALNKKKNIFYKLYQVQGQNKIGLDGFTNNSEFIDYCKKKKYNHEAGSSDLHFLSKKIQYLIDEQNYKLIGAIHWVKGRMAFFGDFKKYGIELDGVQLWEHEYKNDFGNRRKYHKASFKVKNFSKVLDRYKKAVKSYDDTYTITKKIPQNLLRKSWIVNALEKADSLEQILTLKKISKQVGPELSDGIFTDRIKIDFDSFLNQSEKHFSKTQKAQAEKILYQSSLGFFDKLNKYVKRFPNNQYSSTAKDKAFEIAKKSASKMKQFVQLYPQYKNINIAEKQLKKLEKESMEEEYKKAFRNIGKLKQLIRKYPGTEVERKAHNRISDLVKLEKMFEGIDIEIGKMDIQQYTNKIVGTGRIEGAKFAGKKIWQDQPLNTKRDNMNYYEAQAYCENLNLLGFKDWTLPSYLDFKALDKDVDKLTHVAKRTGGSFVSRIQPYISSDISKNKVTQFDLDNTRPKTVGKRYNYNLDNRACVKCVLNPNIYNQNKIAEQYKFEKLGTLDGYLKAFKATGNRESIKSANELSKNNTDRGKIEGALYQYLGSLKVFDVDSAGGIIAQDANQQDVDAALFNSIQNTKQLKHKFSLRPKKENPLNLKYNSYDVKMKFSLKLVYKNVMEKAFLGMDMATNREEVVPVELVFNLSQDNNYSETRVVDFGSVTQGGSASLMFFKMNTNLQSAHIDFEFLSTQINYNK